MKPDNLGETDADRMLVHVVRTIWDNLPQLLFASVLLLIAAYPGLFLAGGTSSAIAWPVLALCLSTVWAGVIAASGRLLDGDALTMQAIFQQVKGHAWQGLRIGIVPAVVGAILLGSLQMLDRNPDAAWLAIPLLLDTGIAIVTGLALVSIHTIADERGLTGIDLWLASAALTMSRPVPVLGSLTLLGMVVWGSALFGPVLLVALAPLAVLCVAVTRDAMPESRS